MLAFGRSGAAWRLGWLSSFSLLVALGLACSDSDASDDSPDSGHAGASGDDGHDGDDSDSIPIESFARELAQAACDAVERCDMNPWAEIASQVGECKDAFERAIAAELLVYIAAVDAGEGTYDGSAARACIDAWATQCPPCVGPPEPRLIQGKARAWCPAAFPTGCASEIEENRWRDPAEEGEGCGATGGNRCCSQGLACNPSSGFCEEPLAKSAPCRGDVCEDGLVCATTTAGNRFVCTEVDQSTDVVLQAYATDRPLGADCGDTGVRAVCNPGLLCDSTKSKKCVEPKPIGEACEPSDACAGDCDQDTNECVAVQCP